VVLTIFDLISSWPRASAENFPGEPNGKKTKKVAKKHWKIRKKTEKYHVWKSGGGGARPPLPTPMLLAQLSKFFHYIFFAKLGLLIDKKIRWRSAVYCTTVRQSIRLNPLPLQTNNQGMFIYHSGIDILEFFNAVELCSGRLRRGWRG